MTIKLIIADDHPIFRQGMRGLLMTEKDIEVVAEAESGEDAVKLAVEHRPDVMIMDIGMPGMNGVEATRRIMASCPEAHILILTMFEEDGSVFSAMRAGARGYLLKGSRPDDIIRAVRAVADGEAIFSPLIAQRFVHYFENNRPVTTEQLPNLTKRELEILDLIAKGCKNQEIVNRLVLSPKTVRNHISNILSKLQAGDRLEAIEKAKNAGLGFH